MTRRSRTSRDAENRLAALESDPEHADQIFAVSIGGDPDKPRGWLSPEEYEQHYGENSAADYSFKFEWDDP
jgi:hypothetical protein